MSQPSPPRNYPNVKARLRLARTGPALPARESFHGYLAVGTRGSASATRPGVHVAAILGDLSGEPRPGGAPALAGGDHGHLVAVVALTSSAPGATELYGDLATGEGWVRRRGPRRRGPSPPMTLAPAAEQMLAGEPRQRRQRRGLVTRLGRPGAEYQGVLEGNEQTASLPERRHARRLTPYLLFSDVRDAANPNHFYPREIVALDEGAVADADLTPP